MEDYEPYFVDVLLPLHLPDTYTYRVPREIEADVKVGVRVVVQFGQKRIYSALVRRVHRNAPQWRCKYVMGVLDSEPVVGEKQLQLWEWIAGYYMCYAGDVMAVAMPAGMKLASESAVMINPDFDGELSRLSKYERMVVELLSEHPVMKIDDLSRAIGVQKVMPLLRGMVEREVVVMREELKERFVPRKKACVGLTAAYTDEAALKCLFDELERKKRTKQLELLMQLMQLSHFGKEPVEKRLLPQGSPLQTLLKNGVLEETFCAPHTTPMRQVEPHAPTLSAGQQAAYDYIKGDPFHTVHLLHGVTSSGKTEIYIKLIADQMAAGRQTLLLLPEIALTEQVIERLNGYFGDEVGVYHSRHSASGRVDVWRRTAEGKLHLLVGARSALFLPFANLGLVIVDEEHDASYKQQDPAPRYNARDTAIYLANLWGAHCLLGSATPSVESYRNAKNGKYGLVSLTERYGGFALPQIEVVDMRADKEKMHGALSGRLYDAIGEALAAKQQVILFQNRRGFSLRLECDDCHAVPQCVHCDVSLVYHKATNSLRCHYCGYSIPVPSECPHCHSTRLRMTGVGTERIEEDIAIMFPDSRVARMDLDSTASRMHYTELLHDFADGRIDILVGTQMVTKGLDFRRVSVVGIVNADNLINYPNFRSFERAYQQMTQVSGRAGRHSTGGRVFIQTYNPHHHVIEQVVAGDYEGMYAEQEAERRIFRYPPYYKLIEITLKHSDSDTLNEAADWMAGTLRSTFGTRVIGPEYPLVSRVRALYLKTITLRFAKGEPVGEAKHLMMRMADDMQNNQRFRRVVCSFDVDPQ